MIPNNDLAMMEEIVFPEHLLPVGSVLGQGVTALDLCMVLAKIFRGPYTEDNHKNPLSGQPLQLSSLGGKQSTISLRNAAMTMRRIGTRFDAHGAENKTRDSDRIR